MIGTSYVNVVNGLNNWMSYMAFLVTSVIISDFKGKLLYGIL